MRHRPAFQFFFCVMFLFASVETVIAEGDSGKTNPVDANNYWIFLTTGKSTQGTERSEIEAMQAAHLANFGRLHKEGKLFTAGPMVDPQKKIRGIVVITAPELKSLKELFEPDPFVKQGFMNVDAIRMDIAVGKFQGNVDPKTLAEYRLVLLEKATAESDEVDVEGQSKNLDYCQSIHDPQRLCFAGWFRDDKVRRGVLVFRKLDDDTIKSLVEEFPAVKSKQWTGTTFPLYMSEGIVK